MATVIGVIVGIVVVLLIAGVVLLAMRQAKRRRELQEMYGPEYDRAVQQSGSRRAAERELAQRQEQREQLNIVPLSPSSRARYTEAWSNVQGRFVDDPAGAITDADELVTAVMRERGYPTEGFDEQARLLSVDHANTLDNYRSGHQIAGLARQRQATTEQLRQGMMHYRSLFQELVEHGDGGQAEPVGSPVSGGQPQAGQPQYGQQAGQPQYGQQAGQPQYGQQAGQPQYGQPAAPPYESAPDTRSTAEFRRPTGMSPGPMEQPTTEQRRSDVGAAPASGQGQPSAYPSSPPPTSPPGMAPGQPQQGQWQPGQPQQGQWQQAQPQQGQMQPGQPGGAEAGPVPGGRPREPYSADDYGQQEGAPTDATGLRRQTDPNQGREDYPR